MRSTRRSDGMQRVGVALSLLAIILSGCSSASGGTTAQVRKPDRDLYSAPDPLPRGNPGQLIWAEQVDLPIRPPATIWRILYHSRTRLGADVAVSGFAFVAKAKAPRGGRPIQAWAHGTVGLGDQCAPSKRLKDNFPPYGYETVLRGGVVVAPDYQGLGTPGEPAGAGAALGHDILDSVRAVAGLPGVGKIGDVVLAGHSQGGAAVLFAAELAKSYAPQLRITGVVALAPGGELSTLVTALQQSPAIGAVFVGALGLARSYPELDLAHLLTAKALADVPTVGGECIDTTVERWNGQASSALFTRDPTTVPSVRRILDKNSPGTVAPSTPLLIVQGSKDEQVPAAISSTIAAKYCRLHATVEHRTYPDVDHGGVIDAAREDVIAWMTARLDGRATHSTCQ